MGLFFPEERMGTSKNSCIPANETVAKPICGKFSTIYKNHFDFRFGFVKFVIVIKQSLDRK